MTAILRGSETTEEYHTRIVAMMQGEAAKPDVDAGTSAGEVATILMRIEAEARRYAGFYKPNSDGRNTFIIFADWVAALATSATSEREDIRRLRAENEMANKELARIRAVVPASLLYDVPDLAEAVASTFGQYVRVAGEAAALRKKLAEAAEAKPALTTQPAPAGTSGVPGSQEAKPVAWRARHSLKEKWHFFFDFARPLGLFGCLPLYATPVPADDRDEGLREAAKALVNIVEGIGVLDYGTWRASQNNGRLKDTKEWIAFYLALKESTR